MAFLVSLYSFQLICVAITSYHPSPIPQQTTFQMSPDLNSPSQQVVVAFSFVPKHPVSIRLSSLLKWSVNSLQSQVMLGIRSDMLLLV